MNLSDYVRKIRHHDWSACMSDSWSVSKRGADGRKHLAALATTSKNHARVWELGLAHHGPFTWQARESDTCEDLSKPRAEWSRAGVNETAWRWVGAYLWVHGVKVTEDEAKALVGAVDGHKDWYGTMVSTAKDIDWKTVDARIKEASDD